MTLHAISAVVGALPDLTDQAAANAARWWADHVRGRTPKNNGDAFQSFMGDMVTKTIQVTEEQVDAFEAALRAEFVSEKDAFNPEKPLRERRTKIDYTRSRTGVDYGPDRTLCNAIRAAEEGAKPAGTAFSDSKIAQLLPWKTNLTINPVGVNAAAGYGNGYDPVWTVWHEVPLVGPTAAYHVVDRWVPQRDRYTPGVWMNGGQTTGHVALVTLDKNSVLPSPVARILRGRVDVEGFAEVIEDVLIAAFRDDAMGGYLAILHDL